MVDHQVGLFNLARDFDPTLFRDQLIAHAALGKVFDIPVVLTTSAQTGTYFCNEIRSASLACVCACMAK